MKATIHLKKHDHPIQDDMCKESLEEIKALVKEKVYHTLNSKHSTIGLFVSKPLSQHLFNEDGGNLVEFLKGKQLNQMMDNFTPLRFPNICNLIASFKHYPTNR
jgi:hypothetical protein